LTANPKGKQIFETIVKDKDMDDLAILLEISRSVSVHVETPLSEHFKQKLFNCFSTIAEVELIGLKGIDHFGFMDEPLNLCCVEKFVCKNSSVKQMVIRVPILSILTVEDCPELKVFCLIDFPEACKSSVMRCRIPEVRYQIQPQPL